MALNLNDLIQKAKAKGITASKLASSLQINKPWQQESVLFNSGQSLQTTLEPIISDNNQRITKEQAENTETINVNQVINQANISTLFKQKLVDNQATSREQPGNKPENNQRTSREQPENIERTTREHRENNQRTSREQPENIERTTREHRENNQRTSREQPENIERTTREQSRERTREQL